MEAQETALYRFFDDAGTLLYVGISNSWTRRFESHLNDKPWIKDVSQTTISWFDKRYKAIAAERTAIRWENPKYNIQSVVNQSKEWLHFQEIWNDQVDGHNEIKKSAHESLLNDYHLPKLHCPMGNKMEWSLLNALYAIYEVENSEDMPCSECQKIAETSWIGDGHAIVCDAYDEASK